MPPTHTSWPFIIPPSPWALGATVSSTQRGITYMLDAGMPYLALTPYGLTQYIAHLNQ